MKIVVAAPYEDQEPVYQRIEQKGITLIRGRSISHFGQPYSSEEMIALCQDADAVLASSRDTIDRRVLEAAPRLQLIVYSITGTDRTDIAAATEFGILVCNSPSVENVIGMAEATVGLILGLIKRIKHSENIVQEGRWGKYGDKGTLLYGKTVGIVGFGRIGRTVVQRLEPWGARFQVFDPLVKELESNQEGVEFCDFDTMLREADIVTIHVPLTDATKCMFNVESISKMKRGAYVVNTSRGGVIDEKAFAEAVQEGRIAGAALDVFQKEPLPLDSPLREIDPERMILTPHKIGHSAEAYRANHEMALESLLTGLGGEVPITTVNREAIPLWRKRIMHLQSL